MSTATADPVPEAKLTRQQLRADRPTWCPGCGDFAVLNIYQRLLEERNLAQESIVTLSGIGCSSRFPYFINTHSVHFIHGRILPFTTGLSLTRPDLHLFVFVGDGDTFSIGAGHFDHCARRNVRMTVVIMDNEVYGLTKKQTSPTSQKGFRSKTDPWGSKITPLNPMKKLIASGATFVARSVATEPKHLLAMMKLAADHDGFSVIECLSECIEFHPGSFDGAIPRKGGQFQQVPEDHDVTNEEAAYALTKEDFPGYFGVFYDASRTTLNASEAEIRALRSKGNSGLTPQQLLQASLDKLT